MHVSRPSFGFLVPAGHSVEEMLAASVAGELVGYQPALQVQRPGVVAGALPAAESQVAMQTTGFVPGVCSVNPESQVQVVAPVVPVPEFGGQDTQEELPGLGL